MRSAKAGGSASPCPSPSLSANCSRATCAGTPQAGGCVAICDDSHLSVTKLRLKGVGACADPWGGACTTPPGAACGARSRLRRFGRLRAPGEVGAAAERLVVARPFLARRQLLLDPVEAAEPSAEVVDHVHERRLAGAGHHGASVLERAVMAEDDVQDCLCELGREPIEALDRAPHQVVADRDLAVQAAV